MEKEVSRVPNAPIATKRGVCYASGKKNNVQCTAVGSQACV